MRKALEKFDEAEKMIEDFSSEFYKKFGFWPVIRFNIKSFFIPKLTLDQLRILINDSFKESFPDVYTTEGMMLQTRKQLPILYRHIFFKIAREIGYTLKDIGRYAGFNHATVLHAVRRISDLLDIKDAEVTRNYNLIKNEIQNRYGNVGDVQHDDQREPNTQSVLLSLLQEGEHKSVKHQHPSGDESFGSGRLHR